FFSSRRRHTSFSRDWSSDVCSSDLDPLEDAEPGLSSQDRRAIENLPPRSALLIVRKGPNLGARFLLDSETTIAGRHPKSEIFLEIGRASCRERVLTSVVARPVHKPM